MTQEPWQANLEQSLSELADAASQRRAWVEGKQLDFPTPLELVCQVFDDSGIDDLLASGAVFSPEADQVLREMSALVADIHVEQAPAQLLADEQWQQLTRLAANALHLIQQRRKS